MLIIIDILNQGQSEWDIQKIKCKTDINLAELAERETTSYNPKQKEKLQSLKIQIQKTLQKINDQITKKKQEHKKFIKNAREKQLTNTYCIGNQLQYILKHIDNTRKQNIPENIELIKQVLQNK